MRTLVAIKLVVVCLIFIVCCESGKEHAHRLKKEGAELFLQKKYTAAVNKWKEAIEITPDDAVLFKNIGDAYFCLEDRKSALKAYEDALSLKPDATDILLGIGKIHILQWDLKSADQVWERLKAGSHNDPSIYVFHGDLLVIKQDLNLAEVEYRQALTIDPNNLTALTKLSSCLLVQKKNEAAFETYNRLVAMHPKDAFILVQMANYWMLAGDNKKAELLCRQAIEIDPENLHIRLKLAELYYGTGQYDEAIRTLKGGTAAATSLLSYDILLIESYLGLGDLAKAESSIKEIETIKPNNIEIEFLKGKYHLMAHNPVLAASHFEFVLKKEPQMAQGHYLLGLSYLAAGHNKLGHQSLINALRIDNMYTDAELALAGYYYKQFDYDLALEHVNRIAVREPENYRAQLIMGNILMAQEQFDSALICFQKARMIQSNSVSPLYFAAIVAEKSGADEKALKCYQNIMENHPEMMDVSARYAELLIKSGKAETAKAYFKARLEEGADDSGFIVYLLGKVCLTLDDLESARTYFETSVAKNPGNSMAYFELARIYKKEGAIDKNIEVLQSAIRNNPKLTSAYVELASSYLLTGNTEKASQILNEGLIRNPDTPLLKNNLAVLYLDEDDNINKAFELAQSAYKRMAKEPSANDTMGWAYYKKGLYRQAEWYIREALRLGGWKDKRPENKAENGLGASAHGEHAGDEVRRPKDIGNRKRDRGLAMVRYHLGLVLKAKGDDTGAKASLEKALEVGLEGVYRKDAERVLGLLSDGK